MSFRSVLGKIIIFFAVIGLLISFGLIGFGFLSCQANVLNLVGVDCSNYGQLIFERSIAIVVSIVWLIIGFAIKGKE